ncbi:MAG: enoyl-CoA hydratase/isomerase family protein [Planctomycetota bacterium]
MTREFRKIRLGMREGGAVADLALNAPKANVVDGETMGELERALESLSGERGLRVVVLSGEGPHFSFGASVPEHTRERAPAMLRGFHGLFEKLMKFDVPILAKVRGQCLGGGFELAAFCHFIFADTTAQFAVPEVKLGVFPPPASLILPLKIGQGWADWMVLTGAPVGAQEAQRMGLVQKVSSPESLDADVESFIAANLLPLSASSLRFAQRASRWAMHERLRSSLKDLEKLYLDDLMATHDAHEGIQSFLEKRKAVWA